jgi:hypothetical protein
LTNLDLRGIALCLISYQSHYVKLLLQVKRLSKKLYGWQQEHWRMGPGVRGIGAHRTWLPRISVNHIHSITGLEKLDLAVDQRLAKGE